MYQNHAADKTRRAAKALPKEYSGIFQANDEHDARNKENLRSASASASSHSNVNLISKQRQWTRTVGARNDKRTLPSASSAESNKSMTPRNRKIAPNAVRPTPISEGRGRVLV
jgi:hypothetical protein